MNTDERMIALLTEIRDVQREHLKAYREFTGRIAANTEQQRVDARQVQEASLQEQRESNRKNTGVLRLGVIAVCVILAAGLLGLALVQAGVVF